MSKKGLIKTTHYGELHLGDVAIPCYVLEDGKRVLSGRGMQSALDLGQSRGQKIPQLVENKSLKPLVPKELELGIFSPVEFETNKGFKAYGYEATTLVDLCDLLLEARNKGVLTKRLNHLAERAELLTRSFAKVGIIALVDEATGYQDTRAKDALNQILQKFLLEEKKPYIGMFPLDFYKQVYRLKNWKWTKESIQKRPGVLGRYTNDIIYERIAPGLLRELQKKNPTIKPGQRKYKHFQFLTDEVGDPALKSHFDGVLALQRASSSWDGFIRLLDKSYPKFGHQFDLDLYDEHEVVEEEKESQLSSFNQTLKKVLQVPKPKDE